MLALWSATQAKSVNLDALVNVHQSYNCASKALIAIHEQAATSHIFSLAIQGVLVGSIVASQSKKSIARWSTQLELLAAPLFKFTRKALQQQLPTAANLVRWGRISDPLCKLCLNKQTNKHV